MSNTYINNVSNDIIIQITHFLSDLDSVAWLAVNKYHYSLITFYEIKGFPYHDIETKCVLKKMFYASTDEFITTDKYKNVNELYIDYFKKRNEDNIFSPQIFYHYDKPLKNLPGNLLKLEITSDTFNQPLDCLPQSLKELTIYCKKFNQPVNKLPNNLQEFSLCVWSESFNQDLYHLPKKLKYLRLSAHMIYDTQILLNSLKELTRLMAEYDFSLSTMTNIHENLTELDINNSNFNEPLDKIKYFPNLNTLELGVDFNQSIDILESTNLTDLNMFQCDIFDKKITYLPQKLESLSLGWSYDYPLNNFFKNTNLKHIGFRNSFNQNLDNLPDSIETISFDPPSQFRTEITKYPKNLTKLYIPKLIHMYFLNIPFNVTVRLCDEKGFLIN